VSLLEIETTSMSSPWYRDTRNASPTSAFFMAGVGLKPEHYQTILSEQPALDFFEVHAENYMCAGGLPHLYLTAIRDIYPISVHGVGLSIGANASLSREHLSRLKKVVDRYEPAIFSEHLAWSTHSASFLNDLLPIPYNEVALQRVTEHIDATQSFLGRQMLLENPATYVRFIQSTYSETDFINEIVRRTGCGLLLDINNVYVSATNHGFDPYAYLDQIKPSAVGQFHLAGHASEADEDDSPLLIDTHDRPIDDDVWSLYAYAIQHIGIRRTLIEWDADIPNWHTLFGEAVQANAIACAITQRGTRARHDFAYQ
jgi:uncharacterized protein (UPF0276 family)